jgi:hypothetical protein
MAGSTRGRSRRNGRAASTSGAVRNWRMVRRSSGAYVSWGTTSSPAGRSGRTAMEDGGGVLRDFHANHATAPVRPAMPMPEAVRSQRTKMMSLDCRRYRAGGGACGAGVRRVPWPCGVRAGARVRGRAFPPALPEGNGWSGPNQWLAEEASLRPGRRGRCLQGWLLLSGQGSGPVQGMRPSAGA